MSQRLRFADLFCGEGGASDGLHQAYPDAEIVGVDLDPRAGRRYPFTFVCADALTFDLAGFDMVWASPPCQGYSVMRHLPWNRDRAYPLLIEPVRAKLRAWGGPSILENVMGARKAGHMDAHYLCGTMFGRRFYRHRLFETNFAWWVPAHPTHRATIRGGRALPGRARTILFSEAEDAVLRLPEQGGLLRQPTVPWGVPRLIEPGLNGWAARQADSGNAVGLGHQSGTALAKQEMGVEWMTTHGMCQAIPPVYARHVAQYAPLHAEVAP